MAISARVQAVGHRVGGELENSELPFERVRWFRRHPLVLHTAALVGVLLAVAPLTLSTGLGWIDDEGAYALQVEALLDGNWDYGYWGADFDPEARWQPFTRSVVEGSHVYPYVKHPVYAAALAAGAWVFGTGAGLYAVPMLGLILAAVVAWRLAAEFEPRAGPLAFWFTAGSPLLVDAYALYAHTLATAVAGGALLAGVRIVRHGVTPRRLLALGGLLGLGVLLRSEALVFGLALVCGVAGFLVWRAHRERIEWQRSTVRRRRGRKRAAPLPAAPNAMAVRAAAMVTGIGALSLGAAIVVERWFVASIVGTASAASSLGARNAVDKQTVSDFLGAKFDAAWRVTVSGSNFFATASLLAIIACVVVLLVVVLWRATRRWQHHWVLLSAAAAIVGVLFSIRAVSYPGDEIPGLLPAWPVLLIGLVLVPWGRSEPAERLVVVATFFFVIGVYLTQYDIGGAVEWGGRFLSPVIPGLAAVVAAGPVRRWEGLNARLATRRAGAALVAVALIAPSASGLWTLHSGRLMNRPFTDDVASVATRIVVIDSAEDIHHAFPKLAWKLNERHDFVRTVPGEAPELLAELYAHGFDNVTVIHAAVDSIEDQSAFPGVEDVTPPETRSIGGAIHVLSRR